MNRSSRVDHCQISLRGLSVAALFVLPVSLHCGSGFENQTASLGGASAGDRGPLQLTFLNNTTHRVVFTAGTYDQLDDENEPNFVQFGPMDSLQSLPADGVSSVLTVTCGRAFAIGSPRLIDLIEANISDDTFDARSLVQGAEFVADAEEGSDAEPTVVGSAAAFEALLGVDFPCNSLLILRFEIADSGDFPFRIDFELIPSTSDR